MKKCWPILGAFIFFFVLLWVYIQHITSRLTQAPAFRQDQKTLTAQRTVFSAHGARSVVLETKDKKRLAAVLIERPQARGAFVFCHPYKQNKEYMAEYANLFPDYSLLFFDFRGHGDSESAPISLGIQEHYDVLAAANFMKERFPNLPLIGLGVSMGGASLLQAITKGAPFELAIIDSAFCDLSNILTTSLEKRKFPEIVPNFLIPFILKSFEYRVGGKIASMNLIKNIPEGKILTPVLILHDEQDDICPYSHAESLHAVLTGKKQLYMFKETKHACAFLNKPQEYKNIITFFINNHLF